MAQTWKVTPAKVAAVRFIDTLFLPFRLLLRSKPPSSQVVRNVLVMEPWHIGDVVLATPALRALRALYPEARITLLGKRHAEELLLHSGLVDDLIVFDIPWTAKSSKYDPRRYDFARLRDLISELRARKFDLTVDARMDLRSNVLTWLTGAPRRIGYDFGGGSFLLTDAVPASPNKLHRVDDWLELMKPLGSHDRFEPLLRVSDEERAQAERVLMAHGMTPGDVIVAMHGGASDARRRWPPESFEKVAKKLVEAHGAKIVWFLEPDAAKRDIPMASAVLRTSLREMMAVLSHCRLFVCNDSGPMHIADALGVPVVAVFLTGNPRWHRPFRAGQVVVGEGTGHDFLVAPREEAVIEAAEARLVSGLGAAAVMERA